MNIIRSLKQIDKILNHPLNKKNKSQAFFRIMWWKINQMFFRLPAIVEINNQIKCICCPSSSCGGLVVYYKLYEYPEMMLIKNRLKPDSIFFDVGANIGVFSLLAGSIITKGKIYSFEPVPSALDVLYQNIRINRIEGRVKIIEKVISDKNGHEKFNIQNVSEKSHISTHKSKGVLIQSVRLDDFCKKNNIKFIDFIKIDVEGAEMKVLKGFEYYLKNERVGVLIIELNTLSEGVSAQKTLDYMRQFKYSTFKIDNNLKLKETIKSDICKSYNIIAISDKKVKFFRSDIVS